jgi:flagellar biosynthetic protein FliR
VGILGFSENQFYAAILLLARVGSLFVYAPLFSHPFIPTRIKMVSALAITAGLTLAGVPGSVAIPVGTLGAIVALLREAALGLLLGYVAGLVFVAAQFGGQVLGVQMGFNVAGLLDPSLGREQISSLAQLYYTLALLLFLGIGGDRMLLEVFAGSVERMPLGQLNITGPLIKALIVLSGNIFVLGFQLVAPILAVLFCVTVLLGVFARSVPQMNMLMIGYSFKIVAGLFMIGLMLPKWTELMLVAFSRSFEAMHGIAVLIR